MKKGFWGIQILSVLMLAGLAACAPGKPLHKGPRPQIVASPDKASLMLAEAADKASSALETLAAIEQARSPQTSVSPISDVPVELRRAITINWVGPVEPITKKLADRAGYGFQTVGQAPPIPVVVSVNVENMPVVDVLRSIGLQLGKRADVKVDGRGKAVEIHYLPVTESGAFTNTTPGE